MCHLNRDFHRPGLNYAARSSARGYRSHSLEPVTSNRDILLHPTKALLLQSEQDPTLCKTESHMERNNCTTSERNVIASVGVVLFNY